MQQRPNSLNNCKGADCVNVECGAKVIGRDIEYRIRFEAGGSIVDENIDVINVESFADLLRRARCGKVQLHNAQGCAVTLYEIDSSIIKRGAGLFIANCGDDGDGGTSKEGFNETKADASVAASDDPNSVVAGSHNDQEMRFKWNKAGERKKTKEKRSILCSGIKCIL